MKMSLHTNNTANFSEIYVDRFRKGTNYAIKHLSSGQRINNAADGPADAVFGNLLKLQTRGLNVAMRNGQDAISTLQIAESAMSEQRDILNRMQELALMSASGQYTQTERADFNQEYVGLQQEISRIADNTMMGSQHLLSGQYTSEMFQVGVEPSDAIDLSIPSTTSSNIGFNYRDSTQGDIKITGSSRDVDELRVLQVNIDEQTYDIDLNYALKPDELQNQLNNIAGLQDIEVSNDGSFTPNNTPATLKLMNINGITSSSLKGKFRILFRSEGNDTANNVTVQTKMLTSTSFDATKPDTLGRFIQLVQEAITSKQTELSNRGISLSIDGTKGDITVSYDDTKYRGQLNMFFKWYIPNPTDWVNGDTLTIDYEGAVGSFSVSDTGDRVPMAYLAGAFAPVQFVVGFDQSKISDSVQNIRFIQKENNIDTQIKLDTDTRFHAVSDSNISTIESAQQALELLQASMSNIDKNRTESAAMQQRLIFTNQNNASAQVVLNEAKSNLLDLDYAKATTEYHQSKVLEKAATMMLAQANRLPQLTLLLMKK